MLFNSWNFIVHFLPVTIAGFYLLPSRWLTPRKLWLLLASLYFYAYWKIDYLPLLLGSILFNYAIAEGMIRSHASVMARRLLTAGIAGNLLLLSYFKYTNFAVHVFSAVIQKDLGHFNIILPLAISFFTFTQISYLVDVYRDRQAHYRFLDYSLFVVLFPHLIAGPIVRHWEIIPQFENRKIKARADNFCVGFALFIFGLCKKFFADSVSPYADAVYNAAGSGAAYTTGDAWLGTIAFSIQIYFDFSSYSDMAIGLARIFGITFPANFDSPYRATSVIAFWERWHRTLTRFLREYVYFSLGGNRRGPRRQVLNIMVTMLLSGLWHGAGWTYIVWGGLHGLFLVVNHQWRLLCARLQWTLDHIVFRAFAALLTFVAVLLAWTFFRAPNFATAGNVLSHMLALNRRGLPLPGHHSEVGIHHYGSAIATLAALLLVCWVMPNTQQLLRRYDPVLDKVRPAYFDLWLDWPLGLALGIVLYLFIRACYVTEPSPFIYFNF